MALQTVGAMPAQNQVMVNNNQFQQQVQQPMVSLGRLIDFSIQRTYHELTILADLLPRKNDIERKIEIVTFANRTRQLFVRLLALVKWAGSASKVEKCASIVSFLDKQAMLFTETADILLRMARETNVAARLPSFQLPCAVEVLTSGSYSRMPACIRDRIVPADPITSAEKRATLLRLNQIIQQRLVTSALPAQMRNLKIEFGFVTFHVDHEFELTLTLMGDSQTLPWRVLSIEILVEDKETGGGKDLVHQLQIDFLQHLVQSRLTDISRPLVDAYNCLHSFCLSLQLEVLQAQAIRLSMERLGDFIRIDEYSPGSRLVILYWRDQPRGDKFGYKLCVEIDSSDASKPLQVTHLPELGSKEALQTYEAIKSDYLSIEKILIHTTHERAKQKLFNLQRDMKDKHIGECLLSGSPAVLQISVLQPCMTSERLLISVDALTGLFLAHIPQFEDCQIVDEIAASINKDLAKSDLQGLFKSLRIWITRERCKKTVESLPVNVTEYISFPPGYEHSFANSKEPVLYYQFSKHHRNYLVTKFEESSDSGNPFNVNIIYYLIVLEPISIASNVDRTSPFDMELPKPYFNIRKVMRLDVSNILHHTSFEENNNDIYEKRKLRSSDSQSKKLRISGYFVPELSHMVCFCEEKLAYSSLSIELQKRSICHQVLHDLDGYIHVIDIVKFPTCFWCPESHTNNLQSDTLSCSIRLQGKGNKIWNVTLAFCNKPLQSNTPKEHGLRRLLHMTYEYSSGSHQQITKMVEELLLDWTAIARLYDVVKSFATNYNSSQNYSSIIEIKSFSYKKLVLGYGPNKSFTVSIYWKSSEKRFQLLFGVIDQAPSGTNPHVLVATQLQHEFNQHKSIAQLVQVLHFTFNPLLTIQNLSGIPLLGVINSRPLVPVQSICIIPQSSTHLRLLYRHLYCLDILLHADGSVAIRDGAYSLFDKSKVVDDLTPIQGLKAFLNKFVDKTVQTRRLSQTEDDNPPSPVESYLFGPSSQTKSGSPSKIEGRVGMPHPMASQGSNPHTPTSPHTTLLGQQAYSASPGQIAPSPSIPEQSPGNLFGVSSPLNPLHAPSPSSAPTQFHSHSPASQYMPSASNPASHDTGVGSPFTTPSIPNPNLSMTSPAHNVWPGSPSIPRPSPRPMSLSQSPGGSQIMHSNIASPQPGSGQHPMVHQMHAMQAPARMIPQRSWAAAIPTILNHHGFELMCRPNAPHENNSSLNSVYDSLSQLERFLGCVFIRRHLQRIIQSDENFILAHIPEPGIIQYKNESLQFTISLNQTMQSLHMKIAAQDFNHWTRDELEILQQFFESKVVCAPYKPNAFMSYNRILNVPLRILKDCIQLMRLEMYPDRNAKWSVHWCLTIPPGSPPISGSASPPPSGMSAIFMKQNKMLIIIQFNRFMLGHAVNSEMHSIIVPLVYDMNNNTITVAGDRREPTAPYMAASSLNIINNMCKRVSDYNNGSECIIFPAIRDIMTNFQIS